MLPTYPAMMGGAPTATPKINSPITNQVLQRNGSNQASVAISGTSGAPFTTVEARAVSIINGTTTAWTQIYSHTTGSGSFTGTLTVNQGWYTLLVRTKYHGSPNGTNSITAFGVGEIIITSGQSIYANSEQTPGVSSDVRSITVTGGGIYSKCADPMPTTSGTDGSIWPIVADALVLHLNLPVCVAACAIGGSTVGNWAPGGGLGYYATYMTPTLALFSSFRTLIWGQGETDGTNGTSAASYESGLRAILAQVRTDTGIASLPCGINLETSPDGTTTNSTIRGAQAVVIADTNNYQLIDMDSYLGANRWSAFQPHLSTAGQATVGAAVAAALISQFGW